ncbi:hypothetical protein QA601_12740 [Chitinispirillales bacterium ANBcel5]|uniref:hypothetical protein n=1 Tax=Cellulosispirillum alkaliphilum TaxID=3039283 RepID=UPI002A54574C|nr:hypothetical protein [Chitinispirillales bacterium ANBcel5]
MGIREEIKRTVQNKLVLRFSANPERSVQCCICDRSAVPNTPLIIEVLDEGALCDLCARRYAPELFEVKTAYHNRGTSSVGRLSNEQLKQIKEHIDSLLCITPDLLKAIARGIVEAPSHHIGMLFLLKDLPAPSPRPGETQKDHDLRVKTYRAKELNRKLNQEITARLKRVLEILELDQTDNP